MRKGTEIGETMENMRFQVIIDGRDAMETDSIKQAIFLAETATLNCCDQVEVYDIILDKVVHIALPEFEEEDEDFEICE